MSDLPRPIPRVIRTRLLESADPPIKDLFAGVKLDTAFVRCALGRAGEPIELVPHLSGTFGAVTNYASTMGILYPSNGTTRLVITKRSPTMEFPNRWVFPGGNGKPGEPARNTAEREAEEEVGLQTGGLMSVHLSYVEVPHFGNRNSRTATRVTRLDNFFCVLDYEPNLVPDEHEVTQIERPTLEEWVSAYKRQKIYVPFRKATIEVPAFEFPFGRVETRASDIVEHFIIKMAEEIGRQINSYRALVNG